MALAADQRWHGWGPGRFAIQRAALVPILFRAGTSLEHMTEGNRFKVLAAIGFVSVIAFSSFALVAALAVERGATDDSERLMGDYRHGVGAARHLELGAERLVAAARGYLLTTDASFVDELADARKEFEVHVRTLEQNLRSPGQEHFLLLIRQATEGYRSALIRLTPDRTGSLDRAELSRVFEQLLVPRRKALTRAVQDLVDAREAALATGQARVRARVARAERRVIGIGLMAPLLALLLAVVVLRRLNRLYAMQRDAAARAEIAVSRRDELLGIVAHDLRSPLNVNVLRANLLGDDARDEKVRESSAAITRTVARMDHLISSLLDSAAIESGQLRVIKDDCAVTDIVANIVDLFEPMAAQKGIAFRVDVTDDEIRISADRERIIQALSNLLSNAIRLSSRNDRVELRISCAAGRVRFDVCDTGPGIPAELRPRIFDRYYRGGGPGRGVGLGLYIAKAIVIAHGGDIEVATETGKGTIFRVQLPQCPAVRSSGTTVQESARTDSGGRAAQPPAHGQRA
jgi:signal transduction histidine kinase